LCALQEKVHLARAHLLPRLLAEHGLAPGAATFPQEVLEGIIEG
jgi:ATP-dependent Lon protease